MIDWRPEFPGEPQVRATVGHIVEVCAGSNSIGHRRSIDGRNADGTFAWSAYINPIDDVTYRDGAAPTMTEAQAAAVAAAIEILTSLAALAVEQSTATAR